MAKLSSNLFRSITAFTVALFLYSGQLSFAQSMPIPEREQLLNGLRILFLPIPGSPTVTVKLRIHSGAVFDLAGKAGEMALLGDLLYPEQATADYFTSELGGRLDVDVNYDSTTITMVGKASEFENIIEVLRNGLLATQFTPDVVNKIRETRIKALGETSGSPASIADRAISTRLFGDFPYGRPSAGSPEDLVRIERGDLMLARDRFLNSNNATLAIIGGVTKARTMRTLRQLLGPWRKSENIVPTTFRQPKPPDPRTMIIPLATKTAEVRLAVRGLARADSDSTAAQVLARVVLDRWMSTLPEAAQKATFVRSAAYTLPGEFVLGTTVDSAKAADALEGARKILENFLASPPTAAEVDRAKREIQAEQKPTTPEQLADVWLDMDTYRLHSVAEPDVSLNKVMAEDVKRVATRILKDAAVATIVVGDATELKLALQDRVQFQVLGLKNPR
jgi:zinc protease